jgi:hypothetical protein
MAILTFRAGKLVVEATTMANVHNLSLTIDFASEDTTPIGVDWTDLVALIRSGTITFTCSHDPGDSASTLIRNEFITGDGIMSTINCYVTASSFFVFSQCMVTTCNWGKSVGAADKMSGTIRSKGGVGYTAG